MMMKNLINEISKRWPTHSSIGQLPVGMLEWRSQLTQVSFDVAWSAHGIDGRYYEYKKIADYSDVIFIMAYDEQSQILNGPCSAR